MDISCKQTSEISHEKTWAWLRKGNLKRETESFNGSPKQRHKDQIFKAEMDKTQLAQKEYKTRPDWVQQGYPPGNVQEI